MPTAGTFADVTFEEHVRVPWTWWLVGLGLIASLAVAVFAYVEVWIASLFLAVTAIALIVGLLLYTLRISFDGKALRAGRNVLEAEYISGAEAFEGDDARRVLGSEADQRDFLVTRPHATGVVRVALDDPADPHPAWLVSTRRPTELAEAINAQVAA